MTTYATDYENEIKADRNAVFGVEVSWDFGDGDGLAVSVDRYALRAIIVKHGFDGGVVPTMDPSETLNWARHRVSRRGGVRPEEMKQPNEDRKKGKGQKVIGIYRVRTTRGEAGDQFECGARVRIDPLLDRCVCVPPEGQQSGDPELMQIGGEMASMANERIDTARNPDIGDALTAIGSSLHWIRRCPNRGGAYVLPHSDGALRFLRVLDDINRMTAHETSAHRFMGHATPIYNRPMGQAMVASVAEVSFERRIAQLTERLQKVQADGMRASAIERRVLECQELIDEADFYKGFMAAKVKEITKSVEALKKQFKLTLDGSKGDGVFEALADVAAEAEAVAGAKKRTPRKKGSKKASVKNVPVVTSNPKKHDDGALFDL